MNEQGQLKKGLKLSDIDKRVLTAYSNLVTETGFKPVTEAKGDKRTIKYT